jgi:hypothetical protein
MGGRVKLSSRRGAFAFPALCLVCVAALVCSPAAFGSAKSVASQASALARSPGAGVLRSALDTKAGFEPAAELSRFLLSSDGPSLTPQSKGLAHLTLVLLSPRAREAVNSPGSNKPPTGAQIAALRSVLEAITRNPAIKQLRAEGERLKRHPAQLRRAISAFLSKTDRGSTVIPVDSSSPFAEIDDAVSNPALGVGGKSLASALRGLLASPGAARYLRSWPPFALSAFVSVQTTSHRPAGASASVGGGTDPGCTAAEAEAGIAVDAYLGKTLTDHLIDELRNEVLTKAGKVAAKNVVSLGKLVALAKRNFGHLISRANVALDAKDILDAAIGLGKLGYEAAYRAAVHCYAARVELVPTKATRVAGEGQLFNLLAYNAKGRQIAAVPPDSMWIRNGECHEGNPDWECFGEKAGADPVVARFGDLVAPGELVVKPGPLHSLQLSPRSSEVGIDETTARFGITGKDMFGNELPVSIGPLSSEAHLSIAPEGKCEDLTASCVAQAPGPHAITVQLGKIGDVAKVEVLPNKIHLTPSAATVQIGEAQGYTATETSAGGKLLRASVGFGAGPDQAELSISPEGTCDQVAGTCTGNQVGPHTVTAETGDASGQATLEVEEIEGEEGGGVTLAAIRWSGSITIVNRFWSTEGTPGSYSQGTETAVFQIDENILDGSTGLDPEKGTGHFFAYSYQIDGAESGSGPSPCESRSGQFSASGKTGGPYSAPGESGFYMGFEVFPDDYVFRQFPIWVRETVFESCPLFSFEINHSFDALCGEEPVGHPLPRSGTHVVDSVQCNEGEDGLWGREGSIDFDLTAICFSGDVPDENWECPGVKP